MAKTVVANALYLEFELGSETSQVILTPQTLNPIRDRYVKPYIISRQMTPEVQRRGWNYTSGPRLSVVDKTEDVERATEIVTPQLKWVSPLIAGYMARGWSLRKQPLVIEMSLDDLINVYEKVTPSALLRRIMKAREEAGFPESITVSLPYIPTSVS